MSTSDIVMYKRIGPIVRTGVSFSDSSEVSTVTLKTDGVSITIDTTNPSALAFLTSGVNLTMELRISGEPLLITGTSASGDEQLLIPSEQAATSDIPTGIAQVNVTPVQDLHDGDLHNARGGEIDAEEEQVLPEAVEEVLEGTGATPEQIGVAEDTAEAVEQHFANERALVAEDVAEDEAADQDDTDTTIAPSGNVTSTTSSGSTDTSASTPVVDGGTHAPLAQETDDGRVVVPVTSAPTAPTTAPVSDSVVQETATGDVVVPVDSATVAIPVTSAVAPGHDATATTAPVVTSAGTTEVTSATPVSSGAAVMTPTVVPAGGLVQETATGTPVVPAEVSSTTTSAATPA